jgi:hypothetical protein
MKKLLIFLLFLTPLFAGGGANLGEELPLWSAIPFAGILLSIAIMPLVPRISGINTFPKCRQAGRCCLLFHFSSFMAGMPFMKILHIYFLDYIPFINTALGVIYHIRWYSYQGQFKGHTSGQFTYYSHWHGNRLLDWHHRCGHGNDTSASAGQ